MLPPACNLPSALLTRKLRSSPFAPKQVKKRSSFRIVDQQQPIEFQNTLTMQDHLQRYTDLPLFHDESKDTTTGCRLIKSVEITANIATWDDKRKAIGPAGQHSLRLSPGLVGQLGNLPSGQGKLE
jgi:hypothetical protein